VPPSGSALGALGAQQTGERDKRPRTGTQRTRRSWSDRRYLPECRTSHRSGLRTDRLTGRRRPPTTFADAITWP